MFVHYYKHSIFLFIILLDIVFIILVFWCLDCTACCYDSIFFNLYYSLSLSALSLSAVQQILLEIPITSIFGTWTYYLIWTMYWLLDTLWILFYIVGFWNLNLLLLFVRGTLHNFNLKPGHGSNRPKHVWVRPRVLSTTP